MDVLLAAGDLVTSEDGEPIGIVKRTIYWGESPDEVADIAYFDPLDTPPRNAIPLKAGERWWRICEDGKTDFYLEGKTWARSRPRGHVHAPINRLNDPH